MPKLRFQLLRNWLRIIYEFWPRRVWRDVGFANIHEYLFVLIRERA